MQKKKNVDMDVTPLQKWTQWIMHLNVKHKAIRLPEGSTVGKKKVA